MKPKSDYLFFPKGSLPDGIDPVHRVGNDVVVSWDSENADSDHCVLNSDCPCPARCAVRQKLSESKGAGSLDAIDRAVLELEKQVKDLEQVKTWADTIENNSQKIIKAVQKNRTQLLEDIDNLKTATDALRNEVV